MPELSPANNSGRVQLRTPPATIVLVVCEQRRPRFLLDVDHTDPDHDHSCTRTPHEDNEHTCPCGQWWRG